MTEEPMGTPAHSREGEQVASTRDAVFAHQPLEVAAIDPRRTGRRRDLSAVALGYRLAAEASNAPYYGVHLNPLKSEKVKLGEDDRIIVLAED
jgi:hypothetical protein